MYPSTDKKRTKIIALASLLAFALPASSQQNTYELPYTAVDGLMVVTITVDEKPLQMVFDTGAVATFLSAESLNIAGNVGDLRSNRGTHVVSGRAAARNMTFTLGQSAFNQYVTVLSLHELSQRLNTRIDGILGTNFIDNFNLVTIDRKAHTIWLGR